MVKARAYEEERLCEECGRPIGKGRENQYLCRGCEEELERRKRKEQRLRQSRRNSRRGDEDEDW
jgi:predicted amidophosphoribosyltransferase